MHLFIIQMIYWFGSLSLHSVLCGSKKPYGESVPRSPNVFVFYYFYYYGGETVSTNALTSFWFRSTDVRMLRDAQDMQFMPSNIGFD